MSGHNKWSKIKHKKAAGDAEKSKVFGKLVRMIQVEARRANGNENDPGLRAALEKARAENMPKDTIERAVKKGTGDESSALEAITYEAYGPGGVAIVIVVLTDSRNRSAQEIKHLLSLHGMELAAPGSATWAFKREGSDWIPQTMVPISEEDGEKLGALMDALEDRDDIQDMYTNAKE